MNKCVDKFEGGWYDKYIKRTEKFIQFIVYIIYISYNE